MKAKEIIKQVFKEQWKTVFALVIFTILLIATRVCSPLLIEYMIDNIVLGPVHEENDLVIPIIVLASLSVLGFVFNTLRCAKTNKLGSDITVGLKTEAFSKVLRADLLEINKLDTNETFKAIEDSSRRIGNVFFGKNLITFCTSALIYLGVIITMFVVNPVLGAIALAGSVVYYGLIKIISIAHIKRQMKYEEQKEQLANNVKDNVTSVKNLKVRNSIAYEEAAYKKESYKLEKVAKSEANLANQESLLINEIITSATFVASIGAMGAFIAAGEATVGALIAYVYLIPTLYSVLRRLLSISPLPSIATTAFEEINSVINIRQENRVVTVKELSEINSLQFDDVCFDYTNDSDFKIEHISFEVRKGETLGILGLTNSGKSTIIDLATKIIRPRQGRVLVNNCDINKVDTYYLRDQIASVPQDAKIYDGSIEHNIIYPMQMDEYRYNDSLNKCHLKSLINGLPKRDQTIVSETSDILTDLEKQRIVLANAFYKDAKIYLLDNVTSKMDATSEKEMMDEILKLKNKITVIVSNRINNLSKCTKILIMNNGKVVEYGLASDLLNDEKSAFARMVREAKATKKIG